MSEIDYVRAQARHDRDARSQAIVALRSVEAENARLFRENLRLRLELERLRNA